MIISKATIAFVLGSAFVSSAIVYDGIAHRHHDVAASTNVPAVQTPPIPKPPAGTPLNAGDDQANDPNAQSTDPSADPNAQADQDGSGDQADATDANQMASSADGQADASDSNQATAPVTVVRRRVVVYASPVVHKVAVVHVLHIAPAAPVTTTAYVAPATIAAASAIVIPTGTQLTLRLTEALGSRISEPGQTFSATLDRDVNIGGRTIFPAGTLVNGRVVSARPAGALAGEANLQLQVTLLQVDSRQFNVQTAVNTFGPTIHGKNKVTRFFKGLGKRVDGDEREVVLDEQTAYTFALSHPLVVQ
jgi:hypothetical protein